MNKGHQFWTELWNEGRTSFHRDEVNPDLIKYWPELNLGPNASVLVPLCGKTLDMVWFIQQGIKVIGIELSEYAVQQFADENQLVLKQKNIGSIKQYFNEQISIWVADIFKLTPSLITPVDAIYDRAALIALPYKLRPIYVDTCLNWLKPGGGILLKTMSYNQEEMQGPPFSVHDEEVTELYKHCADIRCLSSILNTKDSSDPLFERGLKMVNDNVWYIRTK